MSSAWRQFFRLSLSKAQSTLISNQRIGSEVRFITLSSTKKLRLRYLAILIREERNKNNYRHG